jgi:hypothetical protein
MHWLAGDRSLETAGDFKTPRDAIQLLAYSFLKFAVQKISVSGIITADYQPSRA